MDIPADVSAGDGGGEFVLEIVSSVVEVVISVRRLVNGVEAKEVSNKALVDDPIEFETIEASEAPSRMSENFETTEPRSPTATAPIDDELLSTCRGCSREGRV